MPKGAYVSITKPAVLPMVARVYLRVSTDTQDLERQEGIITVAKTAGYYVAGIYREKASGARADRPELLRMVVDLQPGEVVIAERIDRISRLPLPEAERLVASIRAKGARLAVPGVVDLSDLAAEAQGVGVDPTVVSLAAISITAMPAGRHVQIVPVWMRPTDVSDDGWHTTAVSPAGGQLPDRTASISPSHVFVMSALTLRTRRHPTLSCHCFPVRLL